jgi:hypothetical protein
MYRKGSDKILFPKSSTFLFSNLEMKFLNSRCWIISTIFSLLILVSYIVFRVTKHVGISMELLKQNKKLLNGPSIPNVVLHDPNLCGSGRLDWIFIATSAVENYNRRMLLRKTYANTTLFNTIHFKLIIFVGKTVNDTLNENVHQEFHQYRDMVVGDFIDTFRTLSLKLIFGLKWISQYCNKMQYIIKVDDDAFVNIFEIRNLIQQHSLKKNFIMCAVLDFSLIYRWKQNKEEYCKQIKVCIDDDILPGLRTYPRYCNGQMFVFPNNLLQPLVDAIDVTPYFWLDDVYITGLITKNLSVEYINIQRSYAWPPQIAAQYRNKNETISYHFAHIKDQKLFKELWELLLGKLPSHYREAINPFYLQGFLTI